MADPRVYPTSKRGNALTDPLFANPGRVLRVRATAAQVTAGLALLPAKRGWRWQVLDAALIAIGGAVTGATDVRLLGTRAGSSVALAIAAAAGLTQSALIRSGSAAVVVLANGDSFTPLDANTAVTIGKTGGSVATATHVDAILHYIAVKA